MRFTDIHAAHEFFDLMLTCNEDQVHEHLAFKQFYIVLDEGIPAVVFTGSYGEVFIISRCNELDIQRMGFYDASIASHTGADELPADVKELLMRSVLKQFLPVEVLWCISDYRAHANIMELDVLHEDVLNRLRDMLDLIQ